MIICAGPDNSGKTTLAHRLADEFGLTYHRGSQGPTTDYDFWMDTLTSSPDYLAGGVWDRFFFGELVYGPLCRGSIKLSVLQREVIQSMLLTAEPLIIRCELIPMRDLFDNRPQEFDWAVAVQANARYRKLLGSELAYQFDPLEKDSGTWVDEAASNYLKGMDAWKVLRSSCSHGRGQLQSPDLMLVGQGFAKNNRWKVPFERSQSAIILHSALRKAGISLDSIWFTNAIKSGLPIEVGNLEKLEREVELIKPQGIIALGNRASGLLSILGFDHAKVPHPAYYLRKLGLDEARQVFYEKFVRTRDSLRRSS